MTKNACDAGDNRTIWNRVPKCACTFSSRWTRCAQMTICMSVLGCCVAQRLIEWQHTLQSVLVMLDLYANAVRTSRCEGEKRNKRLIQTSNSLLLYCAAITSSDVYCFIFWWHVQLNAWTDFDDDLYSATHANSFERINVNFLKEVSCSIIASVAASQKTV